MRRRRVEMLETNEGGGRTQPAPSRARETHRAAQRIVCRLTADPPGVTIRPDLGHIGLFEFDRAAEAIEAGERCCRQAILATG